MMEDPLAEVKEIYSNFGWEMTPQTLEKMQHHVQNNKRHKYGKYTYNLQEMGITKEDVKEHLAEYIEYFSARENLL